MKGDSYLVGIGGPSCSGKSTVSRLLATRMGQNASTLAFDDYFLGEEVLLKAGITNWERPDLYRLIDYCEDLSNIALGKSVHVATKSRESVEQGRDSRIVVARPFILVEGFLIYHCASTRHLFHHRFFIDLPEDEMLRRRLARPSDGKPWSQPNYIHSTFLEGHRRYVLPQREFADTKLNGLESPESLVDQILLTLASKPAPN